MRHLLLLAWRYLAYHRVRTGLLVTCVALVFLLPFAVTLLVDRAQESMAARAAATPLVVGAKGSRYDLVLNALYFEGRIPAPTSMAEAEALRDGGRGRPIPLLVRHRARGRPVVGTAFDYFAFRGLRAARGHLPQLLGDAVLGAEAAAALDLGPGDTLLAGETNVYDVTLRYPLRLNVVGVLAPTDSADDGVVFVDVKTAWILEGIGHGHGQAVPGEVLREGDGEVALNASVREATEITPANLATFHFHGPPEAYPLTAILVEPRDAKARTILKGRYRVAKEAQLLVPTEVVDEILGFVFRVKRFFDLHTALVAVATALFLVLIVLLTLRVRRRETETLFRIGCARATVFRLLAIELGLAVGAGLLLAGLCALVLAGVLLP